MREGGGYYEYIRYKRGVVIGGNFNKQIQEFRHEMGW